MYQTLEVEKKSGVTTLWMDRPEVYNAFDERLIAELSAVLTELESDAETKILVLAGRGKHFSAGADLNWMKRAAMMSDEENLADAKRFASMLYQLAHFPKPTIARIQGAALGGGTGLAAACHIAIAAENARFATSEVKFGIIPAVISPYVLRAIGGREAMRYFQTAEIISADEALRIHLIHQVVPLETLDEAITGMADSLKIGGPRAQRAALELIQSIGNMPLDEAVIEATAKRITAQRNTDEAREGMDAFFEKRSPNWIHS
ncbi:enoyl-CoA hydratase-related protein [Ignatzschineria sp. RMDPL8A]|uniref:enoyl-CoA hydratase-related protein n=1 Tax=Ignatzschineria sp. RMDPL8A TaxID=2999236 RepID=UPI0024466C26|nr:enoyl-CoA hydratase-related protein [Ignatzschineria sp. RMDPL8A]MDG9729806.1 enoyl-CoA hydratase-related protein [Ignatzschineria sp. RMDPL8A]